MENKNRQKDSNSIPNRLTMMQENNSTPSPASFLPNNNHTSFFFFEPPSLSHNSFNPSPLYPNSLEFLLAENLGHLNISATRHQSMGPTESVIKSEAHSATKGKNKITGLGEPVYDKSLPGVGTNQNSLSTDTIYTPKVPSSRPNQNLDLPIRNQNGLNIPNGPSSRANSYPTRTSQNIPNGPSFRPNSYPTRTSPNIPNGPSFRPNSYPTRASPNTNISSSNPLYASNVKNRSPFSLRARQDQARPILNAMGRGRPVTNSKGLARPIMNSIGQARPITNSTGWARARSNGGRATTYTMQPFKEFKGKIIQMAKDKDGSNFLKKKIMEGVQEDLEMIFEELKNDIAGLMVNIFGYSVVQKLFMFCQEEQITYVLSSLLRVENLFADICYNDHGRLAMIKLLENLSTHDQRSLVISALSGIVIDLSKSHNGSLVVQHCFDHFPDNIDVLANDIIDNCYEVVTHRYGCTLLQPCLRRVPKETMERLVGELGPNLVLLSEHPYGNYLVQYLLDKGNPDTTRIILKWLSGSYVTLSMNKCGSNVVEKCLKISSKDEAAVIILEIVKSDNFEMVLHDRFGNYVVQIALQVSREMKLRDILGRLEGRILSLNLDSHPYAGPILFQLRNRAK